MEQQRGAIEKQVSTAASSGSDSTVLRRAVAFAAFAAVFGIADQAAAKPRTPKPTGPRADDSVFLVCPGEEPQQVGKNDEAIAPPELCGEGRLELRCLRARAESAWNIPLRPLEDAEGISLPVSLLRGGSHLLSCEGDGETGGRVLDVLPAPKSTELPSVSPEVANRPDVKIAEVQCHAAQEELEDAKNRLIETARTLLFARLTLNRAATAAEQANAEAEYQRAIEARQIARARYEAGQTSLERAIEGHAKAVERVSAPTPAKPPSPSAAPPSPSSVPTAVSATAPGKPPVHVDLSVGGLWSLTSSDDLVRSPGFAVEGDITGLFGPRNTGLQLEAAYAPVSQRLSSNSDDFAPRDPNQRLDGFMATLLARLRADYELDRTGPLHAALRGSAGLGAALIHREGGRDAALSRTNGQDLADMPAWTRVAPTAGAGVDLVATFRDRLFLTLGAAGITSLTPIQVRAGDPPSERSRMADLAARVAAGYRF